MIHIVDGDEIVWPRRGLIIRRFGNERDIELCWHWRVPFSLPRYFDADFGMVLIFARPRHWVRIQRDAWTGKWIHRGAEPDGVITETRGPPYRMAKTMNKWLDRERRRYGTDMARLEAAAWLAVAIATVAYIGVLAWAATRAVSL